MYMCSVFYFYQKQRLIIGKVMCSVSIHQIRGINSPPHNPLIKYRYYPKREGVASIPRTLNQQGGKRETWRQWQPAKLRNGNLHSTSKAGLVYCLHDRNKEIKNKKRKKTCLRSRSNPNEQISTYRALKKALNM